VTGTQRGFGGAMALCQYTGGVAKKELHMEREGGVRPTPSPSKDRVTVYPMSVCFGCSSASCRVRA
jgi:hypothetical protein